MHSRETKQVTLRPMTEADAETVAGLCGELGYASDASEIRERFRAIAPSALLVVAADDADVPLGFIQAEIVRTIEAGARAHIVGLVVSSRARRLGIARRLIAEVERWALSLGVEAVVVRSNTVRPEAHEFYPAVGYEKIKTQAVYLKRLGR
jgi:GNAT superfamily N-acetyltransferase